MAQAPGGSSVPLPPGILSLLGGPASPAHALPRAALRQPPPDGRSIPGSSSLAAPEAAAAQGSRGPNVDPAAARDRAGFDGWPGQARPFNLSTLAPGDETFDSSGERLSGAVLSELATSALDELMKQVIRRPAPPAPLAPPAVSPSPHRSLLRAAPIACLRTMGRRQSQP